jgi:hypothetical protein
MNPMTFRPSIANRSTLEKIPPGHLSRVINTALARYFNDGAIQKEKVEDIVRLHVQAALQDYFKAK